MKVYGLIASLAASAGCSIVEPTVREFARHPRSYRPFLIEDLYGRARRVPTLSVTERAISKRRARRLRGRAKATRRA